MIARCRGFTLLEMMLALVLLAAVSQWVISRLPATSADHPLDRLLQSARWASEQAQLEQRIYQLQLDTQRWQISALTEGHEGIPGPLPGTVWQPVNHPHAVGTMSDGILQLQPPFQSLPVSLWYMPDGNMTIASFEYISHEGDKRQLHLSPATLFAAVPE